MITGTSVSKDEDDDADIQEQKGSHLGRNAILTVMVVQQADAP